VQTHSTLIAVLLTAALLPHPAAAATREEIVVESATGVLADLNAIPERCIPPVLLRDARAVAVIPNVIKAGFVIGGSHGRGILCLREADGSWANPAASAGRSACNRPTWCSSSARGAAWSAYWRARAS
jgi:lipid-binding SYLF domain-containing protein